MDAVQTSEMATREFNTFAYWRPAPDELVEMEPEDDEELGAATSQDLPEASAHSGGEASGEAAEASAKAPEAASGEAAAEGSKDVREAVDEEGVGVAAGEALPSAAAEHKIAEAEAVQDGEVEEEVTGHKDNDMQAAMTAPHDES